MRGVIERDRNHPAIIAWCLFNETWGLGSGRDYGQDYVQNPDTQQWVLSMWHEVKERIDPTRLVEDNSADKRDHVKTDLNSWHFYIDDYERARAHIDEVVENTQPGSPFNYVQGYEQDTAPLINSEYGAVSAGGGDRDISWGFRYLTTQLRRHEKIQGYIYTELSDIEFEHNGFYNYDRSPKEFGYDAFAPGMTVADLQGADFVGFDAPPVIVAEPNSTVSVPVFREPLLGPRRRADAERIAGGGERSGRRGQHAGRAQAGALAALSRRRPGAHSDDGSGSAQPLRRHRDGAG